MPRSKLPSLSSIKEGSFEPNKKNSISLGDDGALSTDSKPIKIGEKTSILELSEDSLIVRGALEFDTLLRGILNSPNERMAFTAKTGEYRFYSTHSDEDYVRMYVLGGNCLIEAVDADGGVESDIQLNAGNDIICNAKTGLYKFYLDGDVDDLCTLTVAANGATTIATADSDGTAGNLTLDIDGDIELNADGGNITFKDAAVLLVDINNTNTKFYNPSGDDFCSITVGDRGATVIFTEDTSDNNSGHITLDAEGDVILDARTGVHRFYAGGDTDDLCTLTVAANGVTTIATSDADAALGHLTLAPDGDLILDPVSQKTIINATDGLYFDGGGDTYISETAADILDIVVGGDMPIRIVEDANQCYTLFRAGAAGFTQTTTTYNATDTDVNFRITNKSMVTFGSGNITDVQLYFPAISGNFVLVLKQDGTGSRTVTNWKAFDSAGNAANGSSTVKWAGGSAPTLTTDANHVDILSFYWDNQNEIAYGVATLDFQF